MNLGKYSSHVTFLKDEWSSLLTAHAFDAAVVTAGTNETFYGDDQHPPFHAYGHFLRWVPQSDCENAAVLVVPDREPVLFWYAPTDYWYLPSSAPTFCEQTFDIRVFDDLNALHQALKRETSGFSDVACIGPQPSSLEPSNRLAQNEQLIRQLDYRRAFKTDFERDCMVDATNRGAQGHLAAAKAFAEDSSELEIHLAYLRASEQHEAELPYPSIVALNEHGATLHYQKYDREKPAEIRSLLIDAGGKSTCYHSDITRTYAQDQHGEFAELIAAVDGEQQALIEEIKVGTSFLDLHERMNLKISKILCDFDFVSCTPESAHEQRLTDAFFPHGLGHLLGLQTHDVGGHVANAEGSVTPFHQRYDSLRLLRIVEPRMVFTIEPGLYFIPSLLQGLNRHSDVNWEKVEQFMPYGGIRVEDNVFVEADKVVNLTRNAFSAADADAGSAPTAT